MVATVLASVGLALTLAQPVFAQEPFNILVPVRTLATVFSELYGSDGLIIDSIELLDGQSHSAHFNSDFETQFVQFGTALTSQLVSVPLPALAPSFTYEFDPTLGVFNRTTRSLGPIIAERADTIGAGRVAVGTAFQDFSFDTIEGLDLDRIPAVFTHDDFETRGGRDDVVTAVNSIRSTVRQVTAFVTYGVTDGFDVSLAVPVVTTSLTVVSDATVHRLGTTDAGIHFFRMADGAVGDRRVFTASGSASGIGDLTVRLKGTVARRGRTAVAAVADVRLPTGDEYNLLGSGAPGIKGFIAWSMTTDVLSPHLNAGYLWNGSSVLAGNPSTGESSDMPDLVVYAAGADVSASSRLTFAIDLLGVVTLDATRLAQQEFRHLNGVDRFPNVGFVPSSFNETSMSVGAKLRIRDQLLLDFNLLFRLDDNGLRDKLTPLVGFEYAFSR